MQLVTFLGCLVISKIQCACVPAFYELVCDNLGDVSKNEDVVTLRIGNATKTPTERLSASVFKQTPNLEELTITSTVNELELEAFHSLTKLLVLKFNKNFISVLPDFAFIPLPNLVKLDLQDNNIEEISTYGPFLYKSLKTVNLSFNKLRNLNSQCFAAPGLQTLIITNNQIHEIGVKDVFSPDLITLNLANNEILYLHSDVFQDLQKLEELILSNNRFPYLQTKFNLKSLRKLDLSHNQIAEIDKNAFDGLPQLNAVYLNDNLLKKLPPPAPGLQTLIISNNKIHEIGVKLVFFPHLIKLNLANNEILYLDDVFQNLEHLEELILSNNRFSILRTKFNLKSLRKLDLSHNQIVEIDKNAFDGLPQLNTVYLNDNLLKKLPLQLAKINLTAVHLHNNLLQNLEMVSLNPSFEYELTFSKNPLPCLCIDNLNVFMRLRNITTTYCHLEFYKHGKTPSCIGIDMKWDGGKCSYSGDIEKSVLKFLDMNINTDC